jgi:hypothetical protein
MSVDEQAVVRKIIIRMKQNGSAIAEIINAIGCSARACKIVCVNTKNMVEIPKG